MPNIEFAPPALVTHFEVARALGSDRTRQRWEQDGLLPSPRWIRGFGRALGLYPGVVLARIAAGRDAGELEESVAAMVTQSRALLRSPVFDEAADRIGLELERFSSFGLTVDLLSNLQTAGILRRLLEGSAEVAQSSLSAGISFEHTFGHLLRQSDDGAVVVTRRGSNETFGESDVLGRSTVGGRVSVERVRVGPRSRDYVLPALPASEPDARQEAITDAEWEQAFAGIGERRPIAVRVVHTDQESSEGGDIARYVGPFAIRIPAELYEGANPMARVTVAKR